jgi:Ca2+-binding EF-hand superfamily protein
LPAELLTKADDAFKTYDKERDGYVMAKDLPTILEILGYPMT